MMGLNGRLQDFVHKTPSFAFPVVTDRSRTFRNYWKQILEYGVYTAVHWSTLRPPYSSTLFTEPLVHATSSTFHRALRFMIADH